MAAVRAVGYLHIRKCADFANCIDMIEFCMFNCLDFNPEEHERNIYVFNLKDFLKLASFTVICRFEHVHIVNIMYVLVSRGVGGGR